MRSRYLSAARRTARLAACLLAGASAFAGWNGARGEGNLGQLYGPPPPPQTFTEAEISVAKAECDALLAQVSVVHERSPPVREGVCGAPAPIKVTAIGIKGQAPITLTPPALMTCRLTHLLALWLNDVVSPAAKTHLKSPLSGLSVAASYQCRFRNGDASQRISQHALANAIDIGGFTTANGQAVSFKEHWGGAEGQGQFLREIHSGACQRFGTTLGPNADLAHKSHLHLDAMARKGALLCDVFPRAGLRAAKAVKSIK